MILSQDSPPRRDSTDTKRSHRKTLPYLTSLLAFSLFLSCVPAKEIAVLMSPLALLHRRQCYLIAVLLYLAAISGGWLLGWAFAPDHLNVMFDTKSYVPGRLNSGLWKFGVYLLTNVALLAATVYWWFWQKNALNE